MSEERSAHDLEYPDIPSIPEEQEEDVLSTPSRWETKKKHIDRQSAVMSSDRIFVVLSIGNDYLSRRIFVSLETVITLHTKLTRPSSQVSCDIQ